MVDVVTEGCVMEDAHRLSILWKHTELTDAFQRLLVFSFSFYVVLKVAERVEKETGHFDSAIRSEVISLGKKVNACLELKSIYKIHWLTAFVD